MRIEEQERSKYADMWTVEPYQKNSPGERLVAPFVDMIRFHFPTSDIARSSVLDAGCGEGRGMLALHAAGFGKVYGCDIVDVRRPEAQMFSCEERPLWERLNHQVDFVYCTDVLEHIPPQLTMLVISRLLEVAQLGVFLSISNVPDTYGAWIGKTLHETVQPFVWWRDSLATIGEVLEGRDLLISSLFFVRQR